MEIAQYLEKAHMTNMEVTNFLTLEKSKISKGVYVRSSEVDYNLFTWNY